MSGQTINSETQFQDVLRILRAAVYRSCPTWLRAEADDLVQEAAIKIMGKLEQTEGNGGLSSSYLWRVGYSVVIDEIRRRRRRKEVRLEHELECHVEVHEPDPEQLANSQGLAKAVAECLKGLSDERRQAVTLRLIGHSVRELSVLLGWSYKRSENFVYRGLDDLRSCLREKGLKP